MDQPTKYQGSWRRYTNDIVSLYRGKMFGCGEIVQKINTLIQEEIEEYTAKTGCPYSWYDRNCPQPIPVGVVRFILQREGYWRSKPRPDPDLLSGGKRRRKIYEMYKSGDKTLQQVGNHFGISRERVRQIVRKLERAYQRNKKGIYPRAHLARIRAPASDAMLRGRWLEYDALGNEIGPTKATREG